MKAGILTLRRVHRKMVRYRRKSIWFINKEINIEAGCNGKRWVSTELIGRRAKARKELQREFDRPYIRNYS